MKKYYESRRPKTSMKYFRLLKDNAPAKKTTHFDLVFGGRKGYFPTRLPFSPDLAPCDFFLFPKLKFLANHNPVLEVTNIKIHRPVSYARNENCELFSLLINSFPIPVLIGFFVHLCRKSHQIK